MKIMSLPHIVRLIKESDPDTAFNETMLSTLVNNGCLPWDKRGTRTVADFDTVIPLLNKMPGQGISDKIPRIRTIRGICKELRVTHPCIGIGEEQIRVAVEENQVDCLRIGNRAYLCVEMFDEPYVKRFCRAAVTLREPEPKRKPTFNAAEQISELLSGSGTTPTVKRVRRGA